MRFDFPFFFLVGPTGETPGLDAVLQHAILQAISSLWEHLDTDVCVRTHTCTKTHCALNLEWAHEKSGTENQEEKSH